MPLNLIADPWIPVLRLSGPDVIRPDQISEPDVLRPDWPRPDLNLACLELLIGLVYLACPPTTVGVWRARRAHPGDLRSALALLAPAFNLTGTGPLFLQDMEVLVGEPTPPDMLFIDSAGGSTAKKNADLMVKRGRYQGLSLPLAAMALFTLQAFAPSGGAGNRTSMRGGGPMVTLVRPAGGNLWATIWANVPEGRALAADQLAALPWMRTTRTSEKGATVEQPDADYPPPEVFFGMPRRLRLVIADDLATGVIQRPWGTNYGAWRHPLSPYYALKPGEVPLPRHPKPGPFAYRNWLGIILKTNSQTTLPAENIANFDRRNRDRDDSADILLAGWAMSNMSPLDFIWSEQPLFALTDEAAIIAGDMVAAADHAARALVGALKDALGLDGSDGTTLDSAREAFFRSTQIRFEAALRGLLKGEGETAVKLTFWRVLVARAEKQFEDAALPGLAQRDIIPRDVTAFSRRPTVARIVAAQRMLAGSLRGKKMREALAVDDLKLERELA